MRPLLILSHMRCFTSVISHVLGSHPEISGHSEMHESYRSRWSLFYVRCRLVDEKTPLGGRWMLDKLLHNRYTVSSSVRDHPDTRFLLMVRRPEPTIASILRMYELVGDDCSVEQACEYYCSRLGYLARVAGKLLPGSALFFRGERLLEEPENVLRSVKRMLDLSTPLRPEYGLFENTGQRGKGDVSSQIRSGKILKPKQAHSVDMPDRLRCAIHGSYENCLQACEGMSVAEE
jgi:hypothetical protein